jgi:hypothetical protein
LSAATSYTRLAGLLFLAGVIAGCSLVESEDEGPPPQCPRVVALRDASQMTRFVAEGRDLTDVLFKAEITEVNSICEFDYDDGEIESVIDLVLTARRGPANRDNTAAFEYFVAVSDAAEPPRVLVREQFPVRVTFQGNMSGVALGEQLTPRIPIRPGQDGSEFRIYIGLALSPAELQYNRENQ